MRDRLIELIQDSVGGCAKNWAETIADHLIANGVIVPPCKVGQTVYSPATGNTILRGNVERFAFNKDNRFCIDIVFENEFVWRYFPEHFGKTVFLTREEAEKALKRSENGK